MEEIKEIKRRKYRNAISRALAGKTKWHVPINPFRQDQQNGIPATYDTVWQDFLDVTKNKTKEPAMLA